MPNVPKQPVDLVLNEDGIIEVVSGFPEISPRERAERKKISAKCGHVKRRLIRNEPLTGELLEFAISVIGDSNCAGDDELNSMVDKLKAGQQLSDYELHIMVDVLLLHKRLGSYQKRTENQKASP